MALILKDRIKESTTITGTGDVSLGGSSETFDTFQSVMSNGDTTFYAIVTKESGVDEWEVGLGTFNTGNTLTRTTVYAGSNGTSAVNFSSGGKDIFISYPASKAVVAGEDITFADITVTGTVDGRDISADGTKLDGIESGATADQTAAEIKTAYESNSNTNAFTNAEQTKLSGIEAAADVTDTTNVTAAGALMDSEVTNLAQVKAFDSSDYATAAQGATADAALPKSGGTMTGNLILNADPTTAFGAATKEYVDTIAAAGIHYHTPVRVEAPSALTATYDNGTSGVGATLTNSGTQAALVIDGVTLSTSDRVLVYNQTNAAHNGIYTVTNTGSASTNWVITRATDADSYGASDPDAMGEGDAFFVKEGDTGAGELYVMNTSGTITFGTTNITFTVIAETAVYSAGTGMSLDGTTFSTVQDISTTASPEFAGLTISGSLADTTLSTVSGDNFTINVDGVGGDIVLQTNSEDRLKLSNGSTELHGLVSINGSFGDRIRFEGNTADAYETTLRVTEPTADRTITFPDATGTIAFNDVATTSANGLMSSSDKTKLDGVAASANNYSLPLATSSVRGGVKVGYTENGKNYPVELSSEQMFVNVPWTDTNTTYSVGDGGLTEINFTSALNTKLSGIEAGADVTDTANVTAAGALMDSEVTNLAQVKSFDSSDYATAAQGTTADAALPKAGGTMTGDITFAATQTFDAGDLTGTLPAIDGSNLTNVEASTFYVGDSGDTNYYFPVLFSSSSGSGNTQVYAVQDRDGYFNKLAFNPYLNKLLTDNVYLYGDMEFSGSTIDSNVTTLTVTDPTASRTITLPDATGTVALTSDIVTYSNATTSAAGLMSSTDKTKLDGIETGADVTDTANVTAAGALMDSEVTNLAQVKAFDSSDYAAASHSHNDLYYTETEADSRFVNVTGDTMTGVLTFNNTSTASSNAIRFGPGPAANDDAHIEWVGGSNAGSLRFSTSDDNGIESIVFGDYDNTNRGGTFTAWLIMNRTTFTWQGDNIFHDAYHPNADKWTTARTLSLSGDASGSVSWDGSANATLSVTVADDSHNHSSSSGDFTVGGDLIATDVLPPTDSTGVVGDLDHTWYNGRFTYFLVDNTLTVRNYIDLADSDGIRFGSSDDSRFWYNGSTNMFQIEMESACLGHRWTNNGTEIAFLEKSTGNLTLSGTVDGRDVAADGTKLDGIEASADVTDTANVTAAGALMDSELTSEASVKALDQGVATTDSPSFSGLTVDGYTLQDSTDRSGLLALTTGLGTWRGIQIQPTTTSKWSVMGDQDDFGLYDDANNQWIMLYNENGSLQLYSNGSNPVTVTTTGLKLNANDYITYEGSTNNTFETFLKVEDPTADRTITLPNATGTVWTSGNDGSGSGLDADLLDGQQGSYYLDYNNLTNTPSAGGGSVALTAGIANFIGR